MTQFRDQKRPGVPLQSVRTAQQDWQISGLKKYLENPLKYAEK